MPDELIDIFDANYRHIGTAMKSEAHAKGLWHHAVDISAVTIMDGLPHLIYQRRSAQKTLSPGKLVHFVSGHVGAGEKLAIGATREIKEEAGIEITPDMLTFLGIYIVDRSLATLNVTDREFLHQYLIQLNPKDVARLTPQFDEVDHFIFLPINDNSDLFVHKHQSQIEATTNHGDEVFLHPHDFNEECIHLMPKQIAAARAYLSG